MANNWMSALPLLCISKRRATQSGRHGLHSSCPKVLMVNLGGQRRPPRWSDLPLWLPCKLARHPWYQYLKKSKLWKIMVVKNHNTKNVFFLSGLCTKITGSGSCILILVNSCLKWKAHLSQLMMCKTKREVLLPKNSTKWTWIWTSLHTAVAHK